MSYIDDQAYDVVETAEHGTSAVVVDRRRPGRASASPELLPLLRGTGLADFTDEEEGAAPPLIGIAFAMALSVPLWLLIGAAVWLVR